MTEGGGFAGLVRTTVVDEADLTPADAAALHTMVAESGVLDRDPALPRLYPDMITYQITVEDGDQRHTVLLADPLPPEIRTLLAHLPELPGARTTVG